MSRIPRKKSVKHDFGSLFRDGKAPASIGEIARAKR